MDNNNNNNKGERVENGNFVYYLYECPKANSNHKITFKRQYQNSQP